MTTLITGVGAVGAQVARRLQSEGERVVLYDLRPRTDFLATIVDLEKATVVIGDVNDLDHLVSAITSHQVDRVVHLAGVLTRQLLRDPLGGVHLNVGGTAAVLEAARQTAVKRVVFASTRGVNQMAPPLPEGELLDEDFALHLLSDRPKTMYELTKVAGEYLGLLYNDQYGVDFAAVRLGGGFGPTPGPPSGLTGSVLRPLVYEAALGRSPRITDPSQTYAGKHEFVYFEDDAEAIALACFASGLSKRVYNIRMDNTYEYAEVVALVRRIFPEVTIEIAAESGSSMTLGRAPRADVADTAAARAELGWTPRFDLEEGIRRWAEWIRRTRGAF